MLEPIWEPGLRVLFVSAVATEPSPTLGFHYLHPRDRFWELLDLGGITKGRIISKEERKAMAEGHARGNITDPVRQIFLQKKTNQLLRIGVGIAYLTSGAGIDSEKDKAACPTSADIHQFLAQCKAIPPQCLAFVMDGSMFVDVFSPHFPDASPVPGKQPFNIAGIPVWLMGSSRSNLKGEALLAQEDLFLTLGEDLQALSTTPGSS
jgi:hypothetical protein